MKLFSTQTARRLLGLACAAAISFFGTPDALADTSIDRLGGQDRYETMSMICSKGFESSTWACIATGDNFPDALAASSLAGVHSAPILLTQREHLIPQARQELQRLGVTECLLLGGPNAVSFDVEREIHMLGIHVQRVAGKDRFDTSVEIMKATRNAGSESDTVILTTGENFADSLSVGPYAYDRAAQIVLTSKKVLTQAEIDAIKEDSKIKHVLIVGGTAVVDDSVKTQLGDGYTYTRVSGPDRYRTSAAIAEWECKHGLAWKAPSIATGQKFPDALAGAALAGAKRSPLLLVSSDSYVSLGILATHAKDTNSLFILGGPKAVGQDVEAISQWLLNVDV